jgi:predicted O-methyltransferase YrrM
MIRMVLEYILYWIIAPHHKGFGIHSPFVYDLVTNILDQKDDAKLLAIKRWRNELYEGDPYILTGGDPGSASKVHRENMRSVKRMIRFSSVSHKYGRILYFLARHFRPATIIELGTGLGISTAYLSEGSHSSRVVSVDADESRLVFAARALGGITANMPELFHGRFDAFMLSKLMNANHPLMVFLDGDHRYGSVLEYFNLLMKCAGSDTILVIHDIRWSREMKKAWGVIREDCRTILCIDLFFLGLVFFRKGMMKQNYIIKL